MTISQSLTDKNLEIDNFIDSFFNYILAFVGQEFPLESILELLMDNNLESIDPFELIDFLIEQGVVIKKENWYYISETLTEESLIWLLN